MKRHTSDIENKLKTTPTKPGVYLLQGAAADVLYVGKAKLLRNRLRNHFNPGRAEDSRHHVLMAKVKDFEVIVVDSEVEALILEANLVKEYKPRYNVNLKDDKSYPYIRITNEPYPRVFVTRKIKKDGSQYFGPYTDVKNMRQLLTAIRRIFPIRTCALNLTEESIGQKKFKVCLNYHIGRCYGPCENFISRADYQTLVNRVVSFIRGESEALIQDLTERMARASEQLQFEEAAKIRDQLKALETFQSRQKVVEPGASDRDIHNFAMVKNHACSVVFSVRHGKINNRQHFFLQTPEGVTDEEILAAALEQYYLRAEYIPAEIFIPFVVEDSESLEKWLSEKRGKKVSISVPQKGQKAQLMDMGQKNARLLLNELLLQKNQYKEKVASSVLALQQDLSLHHAPKHIEAFDISHLAGQDTVASMVCFENGQPKKSEYRKFKIQTVDGIDDFKSMAEVVHRRYSRLLDEGADLPDLILIDGGKGQLSSAVTVLRNLGLADQPVIGLAKRLEEVFVPGISDPQNIPKSSPSLHLLQRVRDESHRFAVTFQRSLRGKRMIHSVLDDIPGVGENRKKALLQAFGSVDEIKKANVEDIQAVPGISRALAETIFDALNRED